MDIERPEYHRAIAVQAEENGKIYAFSTGSQLSSRLLSAKSANCFVLLPKAKEKGEKYKCHGHTKAILFGQLLVKKESDLLKLI